MPKPRIFVDTNIILESFRTSTWGALCNNYQVETVEKCIQEALAGNPDAPARIEVNETHLRNGLAGIHSPTPLEKAMFLQDREESEGLHDGESDLLAFIDAQGSEDEFVILLSTSDKAAVVAAIKFGWKDRLRSLEELLQRSVTRSQLATLREHFRKVWLERIKVDFLI